MACLHFRGDARRPELRVVERRTRQASGGGLIRWYGGDSAHVDCRLTAFRLCGSLQKHARHLIYVQWKSMLTYARQRGRKRVDRVVGSNQRAVPAHIGYLELVVSVDFFARLQLEYTGTAIPQAHTAAIGVECDLRVQQLAMLAEDRLNAALCGLFVAGEDDDEISRGLPS